MYCSNKFTIHIQVTITGKVRATSLDAFPITIFAFIHLTQVKQNANTSYMVVSNQPEGKAADRYGSQDKVVGENQLNTLDSIAAAPAADQGRRLKMLTLT
jgi:hypothetical protein